MADETTFELPGFDAKSQQDDTGLAEVAGDETQEHDATQSDEAGSDVTQDAESSPTDAGAAPGEASAWDETSAPDAAPAADEAPMDASAPTSDAEIGPTDDAPAQPETDAGPDAPEAEAQAGETAELAKEADAEAEADGEEQATKFEQTSVEDAAKDAPLTASVVSETQGAHDAVPTDAQHNILQNQLIEDADHTGDLNQLPSSDVLAGTREDATCATQDVMPPVAAIATQGLGADSEVGRGPGFDDSASAQDGEGETGEAQADADKAQEDGAGDADDASAEAASDADEQASDAAECGSDDEGGEGESFYGDLRAEMLPLAEIAEEGLDSFKTVAEEALRGAGMLQKAPIGLLELEHKDLLMRMRKVLGEFLYLADRLYHRA